MDHNTGKLFRTARICLLHFILAGLTGSLRAEAVSVGACRGGEGKNYASHQTWSEDIEKVLATLRCIVCAGWWCGRRSQLHVSLTDVFEGWGGKKGDVPSWCNSIALISAPQAKFPGPVPPVCGAPSDGPSRRGALRGDSLWRWRAPANASAARVCGSRCRRRHGSVLAWVTWMPSPTRCTFPSAPNQSALLPIRVTISKVAARNDITTAAASERASERVSE